MCRMDSGPPLPSSVWIRHAVPGSLGSETWIHLATSLRHSPSSYLVLNTSNYCLFFSFNDSRERERAGEREGEKH